MVLNVLYEILFHIEFYIEFDAESMKITGSVRSTTTAMEFSRSVFSSFGDNGSCKNEATHIVTNTKLQICRIRTQ